MLETRLQVSVVNLIKFIILELLVSIVLEPAWELIISRVAHYRIIRGHRVPLASISHSRTFPCALSIGRVSKSVAIALSFTVLGGSLASEYAVDAISKPVRHNGNTTVYAWRLGRASDVRRSIEVATEIGVTVGKMVDRCYYRDVKTKRYFVNASFENSTTQETPCVDNNPKMTYQVPVACALTATEAHDGKYCTWNPTTEMFETTTTFSESFHKNWLKELYDNSKSIQLHKCSLVGCEKQNRTLGKGRGITAHLYCATQNSTYSCCIYVSDRWVVLGWFFMKTGLPGRGSNAPVIVYRNLRGKEALEPMSELDILVLVYYRSMHNFDADSSRLHLGEEHNGNVVMLMLEGFGRPEDRVSIRDYRKDGSELLTTIDLKLFVPLIVATVVLVVGALVAHIITPKRNMVLQPPVSMEQVFACARAREQLGSNSWWGSEGMLDMGIVQDQHGTQRFSVCAKNSVEYKPGLRQSDESVDSIEIASI